MKSSSRVIEQRNLLGGTDVVPLVGRRSPKRARRLHVDDETRVGFAAALALVVEYGKQEREALEVPAKTRCPRCGRMGLTAEDFGTRVIRGQRRPQSWCRDCRAAHVRPSRVEAREGELFAFSG